MRLRIAIAALAVCCACGPGVEVHGTVGGKGFAAKDSTVSTEHDPLAPATPFVTLWIANRDQLCGYLGGSLNMNYTDLLIVSLGTISARGELVGPAKGAYSIVALNADTVLGAGNFAGVHYYAIDCRVRYQGVAQGGTLTLSKVETDGAGRYRLEGGFSADFGANGSFSAEFSADACDNAVKPVIPISNCP